MARAWRRLAAASRACLTATAIPAISAGANLKSARCSGASQAHDKKAAATALWIAGSSQGCSKTMPCTLDFYGGVIIDPLGVPREESAFRQLLASSLDEWSTQQKRGVWLQLGIELAYLIPIATAEFGFEFHHAERGHVMLTKWLPKDSQSTLPPNASHTIGVGAVVTNDEGKILLVREKSGPAAQAGFWKIPTGLADPGEEIHEAAVREVREETGIKAAFEHFGAFTVSHGGNLAHAGKSNIYFVVKCKALTNDIQSCESEIADARWFSKEEWQSLPFPKRGTIWDELNRSALDTEAVISTKTLPTGRADIDRTFHYPVNRSSL
ncbi:unnamed protein product [Effrenium voratum]|uniref:Nudix hydrolase domain-containing protein n=1 Tax=Effrenium voratum TaxID=2562239 RepID=A0AA36MX04_9DINO|nr:unnamed protein product [Effrenium voratum]CAJ1386733.1 unnamed protein product [Effrenium voratum]CAJ1437583.1 unnamed protein product [Effrenium voratum]